MIVMIGRIKDDDASSADFLPLKRKMNPGLGGSVAERPARPKQQDELAGKFRNGKAFILTDLRYRYSSQNGRGSATNIQGGLADRVRGICDQHHGISRTTPPMTIPWFLNAADDLKRELETATSLDRDGNHNH